VQVYGLPKNKNRNAIKDMLRSVVVPHFEPKSGVKIAENDSQLAMNGSGNLDSDQLEALRKELIEVRSQLPGLVVS
jgi:hypothetical protein